MRASTFFQSYSRSISRVQSPAASIIPRSHFLRSNSPRCAISSSRCINEMRRGYATAPEETEGAPLPWAGVAALGFGVFVGTYYFFSDPPVATGSVGGPEISDEAVERAQLKHWEKRCALQKELNGRHAAEHEKEMAELEKLHPGAIERRKACEARRAAIKEKEVKLVLDRHAESFPSMGGKTRSWAEQKRQKALDETLQDGKMKKLQEKLEGLKAATAK